MNREFGDDLRLALVGELEILLPESAHRPAILVSDHHRYGDQVHPAGEGRGGVVRNDFRLALGDADRETQQQDALVHL